MDIIKAFQNNDTGMNITIQGTHDDPLFRASDIGVILEMTNIRVIMKDFDESEKVVKNAYTLGGYQEVTFLTEKGLYQILFTSRKPIAKQFKNWICEVIKEIRLNGNYKLQKTVEDSNKKIEELTIKNEENLLTNSSDKRLVYLGLVEENIVKFGYSKGIENRVLNQHKKMFPYFVLKYTIHSDYYIELEETIKNACKTKDHILYDRRTNKIYNGKNQTELIKLDSSFTIEKLYEVVVKLNETLTSQKNIGDIRDELNLLKKENEFLKEELKKIKQPHNKKSTEKNIEIKKRLLNFLEQFIIDKKEGDIIQIPSQEFYNKYVEFVNDKKYTLVYVKFGICILNCNSITSSRSNNKERTAIKKIIIDSDLKKWINETTNNIMDEFIKQSNTKEIIKKTKTKQHNTDNYAFKNLINFVKELIERSNENSITIHNHELYNKYKLHNKSNDLSLQKMGVYLLQIPGITIIKGSDKIWSKKFNCAIVKEFYESNKILLK